MASVAFFRNLNQGQRGHPTTAELVAAFAAAGAEGILPVRGNGTVVFTATDPDRCLQTVVARMHELTGWHDTAFAFEGRSLHLLLDRLGSAGPTSNVELSLFDPSAAPPQPLPLAGKGCSVVDAGPGWALTLNAVERTSQATPTLERALGTAVTSRGASTVLRVLDAL